jgi:GAF domain-containing protein
MREPVRRAIWEAVRRGDRLIDLNLLADAGMPSVFEMFADLLAESALGARRGFLLTEPPGREVVAWRQWLRNEMESQIAGRPPRACPFPVSAVRWAETGRSWERLDAARKDAVAQLRSLLAGKPSHRSGDVTQPVRPGFAEDELMLHALGRALAFLGARRAVLCLLAEDNVTVNFGASLGFRNEVADYWEAVSLSADLPASEVIRTGRPALFRTFAELDERYPIFLSTPSESDPALACVPLIAGDGPAVGCLVLGFPKARDFSRREVAFLAQLAAEIASYLTTWSKRDEAERSAARRQALEDACRAISSAENTDELARALVEATVSLVAEGASMHLVENEAARYLTTYHRDPTWVADVAGLLRNRLGRGTDMIVECARTGQPSVRQFYPEEVIVASAADEDEAALLRRLAIGSAGVFPIRNGGRLLGVLSFSNGVGRFISDEDLSFARRLADQAGAALARLGSLGPS